MKVALLLKSLVDERCWETNNSVLFNSEQVNGSLLPASVISVYCAYVCYTALSSEPRDYVCNGLHNKTAKAVSISTLILGMITTVLSVLYSALRAGSSKAFLTPPSSPRAGMNFQLCLLIFKPYLILILVYLLANCKGSWFLVEYLRSTSYTPMLFSENFIAIWISIGNNMFPVIWW